jgi:NTE family protein
VLGAAAWANLRERMHERRYAAGEQLVGQGDLHPDFFVIVEGVTSVTAATPRGDRRELGRVFAGECVGEMSLLTGEPASAEVSALTPVRVLAISQQELGSLGSIRTELFEALSSILATRLKLANERLMTQDVAVVRLVCCPPHLVGALDELPGAIAATTTARTRVAIAGQRLAAAGGGLSGRGVDVRLIGDDSAAMAEAATGADEILIVCDEEGYRAAQRLDAHRYVVVEAGDSLPTHLPDGDLIVVGDTNWTAPAIRQLSSRYGRRVAGILPRTSAPSGLPRRPIDKLARVITERTVGVAFGAGAAKGLAHLGVLRAIEDLDVPVDMVSGCSIGSAVAACVATHMPVDEFRQIVTRVAKRAIRPTIPIHSFLSNAAIKDELRRVVGERLIEDLPDPLSIAAVDIYRRTLISFTSGLLWPRIAASMAIPGVYPASAGMGSYLVDGGVLSPVPVRQCRELGAGIVIGIRLTATETLPREELDFRPKRPYAVEAVIRSFDIMLNRISEMSRDPADVNVEVCVRGTGGIRDFERVDEISDEGYAATMAAATDLHARLPYIQAHAR